MARRQTPAKVDGMLDFSGPGETLAAAGEDTEHDLLRLARAIVST
jgi:hypothetical protein